MSEDKESKLKEYRKKIIDAIEKSQLEDEKLAEDSVQEPSQDLYPDEFTEEHEGTSAPLEKAGSEEIDKSTRSKRFAKEHELSKETEDADVEEETDFGETDPTADE